MTTTPPSTPSPNPERKRKIRRIVIGVILTPIVLFGLYTWFVLSWSYSEGERSGVLQKISRKGWLCKTYEGELAMTTVPGVAPVLWQFSVRSDKIFLELEQGLGRSVVLHYSEHRGLPFARCFGETSYFVEGVTITP